MSNTSSVIHSIRLPDTASDIAVDTALCWSPTSLWMPHRIVVSGWLQHAPFAFWLTEAARPKRLVELGVHNGFSYLAFCQAVQDLGLSTTCYGIDTWQGDEHAGYYGPEVLVALKDYHDRHYSSFSQLIQSNFAQALDYFEDGSIDLLHIDGLHFYENVNSDFEAWKPKMSQTGIVLLHDTNVREKQFGVWKLWQELSPFYPSFEFKHGHGLGVLAVGTDAHNALQPLFLASHSSAEKIQHFYARLGSSVTERWELDSARSAIALKDNELTLLRGEVKAREDAFLALQGGIENLRATVNAAPAAATERIAALRAELDGMATAVSLIRPQLEAEEKLVSTLRVELFQKTSEISAAQAQCGDLRNRIALVDEQLALKADESEGLKKQLAMTNAELAILSEQMAHQAGVQRELAIKQDRIDALESEADQIGAEQSALKNAIDARDIRLSEFNELLQRSAAELRARVNTVDTLRQELDARTRLADDIRQQLTTAHEVAAQHEQKLTHAQARIAGFESSTSWRITAPLRGVSLAARAFAGLFRRQHRVRTLPLSAEALPPVNELVDHKAEAREAKRRRFINFIASEDRIALRNSSSPVVSVLIVTHNSPELILGCLSALAQNLTMPAEVIIFDNASDQETIDLLHRVDGAAITFHDKNLHFLLGVNLASRQAKGRYVLMLNSDAEIAPGAVEAAIETLEQAPNAGAIGGRIILPGGKLQEAGCIIWNDGSCAGYGRGQDPDAMEFNWRRVVDFCSGVFLLMPRELFVSIGGFDEAFAPAYYEEVDLAVRLREVGKHVIYEPRAIVHHHEYGSSDSSRAVDLMRQNQMLFCQRHRGFLSGQHAPDQANILSARSTNCRAKRILYIEDDVPVSTAGAGMPRAKSIVRGLRELGYEITFVALQNWARATEQAYTYLPSDVELADLSNRSLEDFLASRAGYFGRLFVSRPHNMAPVAELRQRRPQLFAGAELIYDAEAIFAFREKLKSTISGVAKSTVDPDELLRSELEFARSADRATAVNEIEREAFLRGGVARVDVLSHTVDIAPTQTPFRNRRDFLFVGRLEEDDSPNVDSIVWFVNEVMPLVDAAMEVPPRLFLIGRARAPRIKALDHPRVILLGETKNIRPWLDRCKVFVAPTRYAAGIPHKICEAGAAGLPVVGTDLLFSQLGWKDKKELRSATTAEDFSKACVEVYGNEALWHSIRQAQLELVDAAFSRPVFDSQLKSIFASPAEDKI